MAFGPSPTHYLFPFFVLASYSFFFKRGGEETDVWYPWPNFSIPGGDGGVGGWGWGKGPYMEEKIKVKLF